MRVILDMAISPNGMIAREDGDEDWLPADGWDDFLKEAKRFNNIVMGRETYDQVTARYKDYNFDNVEVDHKVIVTKNPDFKAPEGYVVVDSPEAAMDYIKTKNLSELFLIGGGKLNSAFIKRGLVDEIHLTINPYIIGKGRSFVGSEAFDLPLKLINSKIISGDRIAVTYQVVKGKLHDR